MTRVGFALMSCAVLACGGRVIGADDGGAADTGESDESDATTTDLPDLPPPEPVEPPCDDGWPIDCEQIADIEVHGGYVYFGAFADVFRADIESGAIEWVTSVEEEVGALRVAGGRVYVTDFWLGGVWSAPVDGSAGPQRLADGIHGAGGLVLTDTHAIVASYHDGPIYAVARDPLDATILYEGFDHPGRVRVVGDDLYFAEYTNTSGVPSPIYRGSTDGSAALVEVATVPHSPFGLIFDAGYLYWGDYAVDDNAFQRSAPGSGEVETLTAFSPYSVTVRQIEGEWMWVSLAHGEDDDGGVGRVPLAGGDYVELLALDSWITDVVVSDPWVFVAHVGGISRLAKP